MWNLNLEVSSLPFFLPGRIFVVPHPWSSSRGNMSLAHEEQESISTTGILNSVLNSKEKLSGALSKVG